METYKKYRSALGYVPAEDSSIDSYGVDHSGFTTQDEVAYQNARVNRENELINRYNQQGINDNYPQQGVGFWGDAANNYGFGSSNIGANIENVTNRLGTPKPQNSSGFSNYNNHINSNLNNQNIDVLTDLGYSKYTPQQIMDDIMPRQANNILDTLSSSTDKRQENRFISDATNDFSNLANTPMYMGLTAAPDQARLRKLDTNLITNREIINSPYSDNILENDCYASPRFEPFAKRVRWNEGENQGIIYATPEKHGTDQPTRYGISQDALTLYRKKYKELAQAYPEDVKYLTQDQAMNLLCQYYKSSRAEAINDPNLAFAHYDSYFNGEKNSVKSWQMAFNELSPDNISVDGTTGSELINTYNSGHIANRQKLYDIYLKYRLPTVREWARKGISNRTKRYR